jgi:hypothetical protein
MPEYLKVLFPQQRDVLINGEIMGETNTLLELEEGGYYMVSLAPPPDFTPEQQQVDLHDTSILTPKQIEFMKKT